ncbi:MAG: hypothetical protein JXP73_03915 [Deltaproteobacteria bacterium]|nr:hypothetical protein [Deltaproteobacteria bacterium]
MRHKALSRRHCGAGIVVSLAILVGLAGGAAPAHAKRASAKRASAGKRIAVLPPAEGAAKHAAVMAKIATVLKQHKMQAITGGPVKKALAKSGIPASDDEWVALARRLKADGMLESTISASGAKRRIEVAVHSGADGSVVGSATFAAKGSPAKLAAVVASGFWKKLGKAVKATAPPKKGEPPVEAAPSAEVPEAPAPTAEAAEAAAPAESEETGEAEGEEEDTAEAPAAEPLALAGEEGTAPPPARKRKGKRRASEPRALEVEVGFRALQRLFEYAPTSAATAYVRHFLPVVQARVAWFPITYAGAFLAVEINPWLSTEMEGAGDVSYPTGTREIVIGPQGRYPLSFGLVGLSAAYFQHVFQIGDPSDTSAPLRFTMPWPDVAYQGVRLAASGRFYLWNVVTAGAEAAYRVVTSPGEGGSFVRSSSYFPNGKTSFGFDVSAFASVGVLRWLEIRAGVDYRRYSFGALQTESGSANSISATGATDQYLGFTLSAVGYFGGK